jgi:single-strand DNA-binding protein
MGINRITLLGFVGNQPEITNTEKTKIARFSIATSETFKDKSGEKKTESIWHNVVIFGKLADVVENYIKKGSQLYIEGKQVNRSFEKDGKKYYISEVISNKIEMLGSKSSNESTLDVKVDTVENDIVDKDEFELPF